MCNEPANGRSADGWVYPLWAFFLAFISLVAVFSVSSYGVSWDAVFRSSAGDQKLAYYQALASGDLADAAALRGASDRYPGLFDLLNAVVRRALPVEDFFIGQVLSMSFGLFGILGCMLLGRQCFGPWAGLFAGVALACSMRYWGHLFINPKDIPFAAMFIWGIWAWMRMLGRRDWSWRSAVLFGCFLGASMSVRIGGLLLLFYAGLFLGWPMISRMRGNVAPRAAGFAEVAGFARWLVLAAVTGFAVLALFWPALHENPFGATVSTLHSVSDFGWEGIVRYGGEWLRVGELPPTYLLTWFVITLPDLWLGVVLAALGVLIWKWHMVRAAVVTRPDQAYRLASLLFMAAFPLIYIFLKGSTVYDGLRHVLFILPILAVGVGFLLVRVTAALSGRKVLLLSWSGLVAIGISAAAVDGLRLHPYQYIYFNRLSGGLAKQGVAYEHDYWGTAYREGAELLSSALPRKPDGRPWRLTMQPPLELLVQILGKPVVPPPALVQPFLRDDIQLVGADEDPELYIASTRTQYHRMREGVVLHEIERAGIVLLQVKLLGDTGPGTEMEEKLRE